MFGARQTDLTQTYPACLHLAQAMLQSSCSSGVCHASPSARHSVDHDMHGLPIAVVKPPHAAPGALRTLGRCAGRSAHGGHAWAGVHRQRVACHAVHRGALPCVSLRALACSGRFSALCGVLVRGLYQPPAWLTLNPILNMSTCTQVGMFGGTPAGGMYFGAAHGSDTHVPCSTMLGASQAPGWPLRMQRGSLH